MNNKKYFWWSSPDAPESCNYIIPVILEILDQVSTRQSRILDIGSGNGFLCSQLSQLGYENIMGIEPDQRGFEISKINYPHIKFHNLGADAEPSDLIDSNKGLFDIVISTEVIEHVYSPAQIPALAAKVLQVDGYLIISTPYHGYVKNLALAIANKWDFHHHPLVDGGHIKFWSINTLSRLLQTNGFEVIAFHGVGRFPFLWKSMILVSRKINLK